MTAQTRLQDSINVQWWLEYVRLLIAVAICCNLDLNPNAAMINNEHILSREEMKPLFLNPTIIFKEAGCLPFMSVNVSFTAALIPYKILAYLGHLPFCYAWPRVCYASIVPEVELVPLPSVCSMFLQASGSWCILCASDLIEQRDGNLFDFEIIEMKYKNIQEIICPEAPKPWPSSSSGPTVTW